MTVAGFVVVSGLPASGKTTVAQRLAGPLRRPVLDKDEILESLFDADGVRDAAWRRRLSRRSDVDFRARAEASPAAILVSFWHAPGMAPDSGTPTDWVLALPGPLVHLRCDCPPEAAHQRFATRRRHPGHGDAGSPLDAARFDALAASLDGLFPGIPLVRVDTSRPVRLEDLIRELDTALARPTVPASR